MKIYYSSILGFVGASMLLIGIFGDGLSAATSVWWGIAVLGCALLAIAED